MQPTKQSEILRDHVCVQYHLWSSHFVRTLQPTFRHRHHIPSITRGHVRRKRERVDRPRAAEEQRSTLKPRSNIAQLANPLLEQVKIFRLKVFMYVAFTNPQFSSLRNYFMVRHGRISLEMQWFWYFLSWRGCDGIEPSGSDTSDQDANHSPSVHWYCGKS